MTERILQFPENFSWGTATAAYQIEGACFEDGKKASIWDSFSHTPGKILDGTTGDRACDHYHRYQSDVDMMKRLNFKNYRFSLAWPRVCPDGNAELNRKGTDFYCRLVDALLEAGITPYATLYHWDLPQSLQDKGGWVNRETAYRFAEYAEQITLILGNRVKNWMTHNEPWVSSFVGNLFGDHAPGLKDLKKSLQAAHHVLLSHGLAMPVIQKNSPGCRAGIVHNLEWVEPASSQSKDLEAAARHDGAFNRWFLDPVFKGSYPRDMMEWYGESVPEILPGDMRIISHPMDFLGINFYTRRVIAHDPQGDFIHARKVLYPFSQRAEFESWENNPEALYRLLIRIKNDYGNPPMMITENGTPLQDKVEGSSVHDSARIAYLRNHMAAAWQAIQDGVDLQAYFVWTLMDNFEWSLGNSKRFGLVYTDFETQERIVKDSGNWFSGVCRTNRIEAST
jgi:beta-glucosidase